MRTGFEEVRDVDADAAEPYAAMDGHPCAADGSTAGAPGPLGLPRT